ARTSPSRPPTARRSSASTLPASKPEDATPARPACARITPATTPRSCSIPTATTSRPSTTAPRSARRPRSASRSDQERGYVRDDRGEVVRARAARAPPRREAVVAVLDPGDLDRGRERVAGNLVGRAEGIAR